MTPRTVLFVIPRLHDYRVALFERLRQALASAGLTLEVAAPASSTLGAVRGDEGWLNWMTPVRSRTLLEVAGGDQLHGAKLIWQSIVKRAVAADLVVLHHEARFLSHLPVLAARRVRRRPSALFGMVDDYTVGGHGRTGGTAARVLRDTQVRSCDWYFAYTEGSARRLQRLAFPPDRVTAVQNAVDTTELVRTVDRLRRQGAQRRYTAAFIGSFYADKAIPYLLDAGRLLARRNPHFRLIVGGGGELRSLVESAAQTEPWIDYRGRLTGASKAAALAEAEIAIYPGQVGLAVLEMLASGCPPVMRALSYRGPETEYAVDGVNALVLRADAPQEEFATAVGDLLDDPGRLRRLGDAGVDTGRAITIDGMVERFAAGIDSALRAGVRHRRGTASQ